MHSRGFFAKTPARRADLSVGRYGLRKLRSFSDGGTFPIENVYWNSYENGNPTENSRGPHKFVPATDGLIHWVMEKGR